MKRIIQLEEQVSLYDLATRYNLSLMVEDTLAGREKNIPYFTAWLVGVKDVNSDECSGCGATEDEAIVAYAWEISHMPVIIRRPNETPIVVELPRVVYETVEK